MRYLYFLIVAQVPAISVTFQTSHSNGSLRWHRPKRPVRLRLTLPNSLLSSVSEIHLSQSSFPSAPSQHHCRLDHDYWTPCPLSPSSSIIRYTHTHTNVYQCLHFPLWPVVVCWSAFGWFKVLILNMCAVILFYNCIFKVGHMGIFSYGRCQNTMAQDTPA